MIVYTKLNQPGEIRFFKPDDIEQCAEKFKKVEQASSMHAVLFSLGKIGFATSVTRDRQAPVRVFFLSKLMYNGSSVISC
jgi:hypothetical protein